MSARLLLVVMLVAVGCTDLARAPLQHVVCASDDDCPLGSTCVDKNPVEGVCRGFVVGAISSDAGPGDACVAGELLLDDNLGNDAGRVSCSCTCAFDLTVAAPLGCDGGNQTVGAAVGITWWSDRSATVRLARSTPDGAPAFLHGLRDAGPACAGGSSSINLGTLQQEDRKGFIATRPSQGPVRIQVTLGH